MLTFNHTAEVPLSNMAGEKRQRNQGKNKFPALTLVWLNVNLNISLFQPKLIASGSKTYASQWRSQEGTPRRNGCLKAGAGMARWTAHQSKVGHPWIQWLIEQKAQGSSLPISCIYMWRESDLNDSWPLAAVSSISSHGGMGVSHRLMFHDCIKLISQKTVSSRDSISFLPSPPRTYGKQQKHKPSDLEIPTQELLQKADGRRDKQRGSKSTRRRHELHRTTSL